MLHDPKKEARIEEETFHAKLEDWQRLLLKAADKLRERGWTKYKLANEAHNVCAIGAMYLACGANIMEMGEDAFKTRCFFSSAMSLAQSHFLLAAQYYRVAADEEHYACIPDWNDHVCESQDEVIKVMQLAALG